MLVSPRTFASDGKTLYWENSALMNMEVFFLWNLFRDLIIWICKNPAKFSKCYNTFYFIFLKNIIVQ